MADDSSYSVNLDEFEVAAPMTEFYCPKITRAEYDDQASNQTELASVFKNQAGINQMKKTVSNNYLSKTRY